MPHAVGRCISCRYWHPCGTIVPGCQPEKVCGLSLNMSFGMSGQDGRAVITQATFGCIHFSLQREPNEKK